ncbi:MAG: sporulation integral membrane protein YlbJ [Thermoanaerobacteraceae bacterium]
MKSKNSILNVFVLLIVLLVISLIIFPKESMEAAKNGINLWLFIITPSLLPFFIGSELLIQMGIVHFLGTFLEPIMRKVFRVPGSGSFAMAIGYTSGYPVGAQIISRLWEEKLCTTTEAERLMAFCNNSGPLFMLGAVAIGMFNNNIIGYIIIASNYLSAITTGILFRFYKKDIKTNTYKIDKPLKSAFKKMYDVRNENKKSFSSILSDAIIKSMNTIIMIGGYIVFFSVIIEFLNLYGVLIFLSHIISPFFSVLNFDNRIVPSFLSGMLEITVGSNLISQTQVPINQKIIIVSSIIAWGGISIHGQVMSVIAKTKIAYFPYFMAKLIQFVFAGIYSYLILLFVKIPEYQTLNVFNDFSYKNTINIFEISLFLFLITSLILLLIGILTKIYKSRA